MGKKEKDEANRDDTKKASKSSKASKEPKNFDSEAPKKWVKACFLPIRKFVYQISKAIAARVGQRMHIFYAVYSTMFGIMAVCFIIYFPSFSDVGYARLKQTWALITCNVLIAVLGIFGFSASITRNPRLSKHYFFGMPLYVVFGIGPTWTLSRLRCNCDSYVQCSALTSFAEINGETFLNPYPAPLNINKFAAKVNREFSWKQPPRKKDGSSFIQHISSVTLNNSLQRLQMVGDGNRDHVPNDIATVPLSILQDGGEEEGIGSFLIQSYLDFHNLQVKWGSSTIEIRDQDFTQFYGTQNSSITKKPSDISSTLSKQTNKDPRIWYNLAMPLGSTIDHDRFSQSGDTGASTCETTEYDSKVGSGIRLQTVHCRNGSALQKPPTVSTAPGKLTAVQQLPTVRCPPVVDNALQACADSESCGSVKIHFKDGLRPEDKWTLEICQIGASVPITEPESGPDDQDPQWLDAYDIELYFKKFKKDAGGNHLLDIRQQAKMTHEDWLTYLVDYKDKQCTCSTSSLPGSCNAYEEIPGDHFGPVSYWCRIDGKSKAKKACADQGVLDKATRTSGGIWTKGLCEAEPQGFSNGATDNLKAQCECAQNMGLKMEGDEVKDIRADIRKSAKKEGYDSVMIGYKCAKWLKKDIKENKHWCVVGFDSACADRQEKVISANRGLRVWVSSIPCQRAQSVPIIHEAKENCSRFYLGWMVCDVVRYLLWPVMFFALYIWCKNRCRDEEVRGGETDEGGWGKGDSGSSGYGDSSDSWEGSSDSSEASTAPKKSKGKGNTKQNKKSDFQSDDSDSDESFEDAPKERQGRKKQSEWSDDEEEEEEDKRPSKKKKKKKSDIMS
eukprot:gnl/MRDRNA2_/MRDRNA2_97510_c0_seq1.p1 gnl/MRDRNA2_/MRDRNA2_97510_c0~~gnl/MRDRNA2_/MRDRNA2_97510_c0_seq1.p1  ORF type:complete len:843 (-),score=132.77 gnl/MRDRNA2_/MRDRNA2_97510_c0_seq1:38-2566(-)